MRDVLTFVLAGGKGERLNPLTRDRAKPAVPFGGVYRIVDFTLSNCVNSGLRRVYLLIQYKSFSLQKHILSGWDVVSSQLGEFIDVIPAQQRLGEDWYRGTADAIHQNLNTIHDHHPELILILAGDHLYKMDYRRMIDKHIESGADMTVSCLPMPKEESSQFGVIEVDQNNMVSGFQEKPDTPKTIPNDPDKIFASMGIYLFNRDVLIGELEKDFDNQDSAHDFGKNIIPQMIKGDLNVLAYNFGDQASTYWRDIGTRDAYYQANMDLVSDSPQFNLYDKSWPIRTDYSHVPPINVRDVDGQKGEVVNSIISPGCTIYGARVERSVLSSSVMVQKNAEIMNSVLMEGVVIAEGAKIKNAIIDKQVVIPAGEEIGFDLEADTKRFAVTASGVVIVPKREVI